MNGKLCTMWLAAAVLAAGACGDDGDGGGTDGGDRADAGGPRDSGGGGVDGALPDSAVASDAGGPSDGGDPDAGSVDAGAMGTVFEEVDGLVAVEAEHFDTNDDNGTPRAWYLTSTSETPDVTPDHDPSHAESASGEAYMEGLPDTRVTHDDPISDGDSFFNTPGDGPTLTYRVHFNTPGRYYVWARAYSTGTEDNGIHVGIDDTWPDSGRRIQWCSGKNQWTWSSAQRDSGGTACGTPLTIHIDVDSAGEHLVRFSMREDGMEFDKFILAMDDSYVPEGAGPAERTR